MGHGLIAWIIIGLIAGWLTGKLMKGSGFGFFMDMIVGLVGALIGGFLASHLGLGGVGEHGLIISIIIATVGAVILTWIVRLISGNRKRQPLIRGRYQAGNFLNIPLRTHRRGLSSSPCVRSSRKLRVYGLSMRDLHPTASDRGWPESSNLKEHVR
ncbi:MAG: GlsB/YeaQ/YmgE family stress response membrane protein [Terracidiphilus sp.]